MAKYLNGPSTLQLTGQPVPVQPGATFDHDFSVDGPEGEFGPSREAALIAAGAITPAPVTPVQPTSAAPTAVAKE